jgi:energy-coupling factor transport system ATP-binding protein
LPKQIVTVEDFGFRYLSRQEWALDGISFEIDEREFIGVTGASGAGKSTLCLGLTGLVPHIIEGTMRGRIIVDESDTREAPISKLSGIIGIVFQDPRSQLTGSAMTVEEEVAFGLQNLGVPREEMRVRIHESLTAVGLNGFETRAPFELSGGEQQRLSLATVLAMRPRILVLDEPTEMLDPEGLIQVMTAIRRIHEDFGITTILVSNQPQTLVEYVTRVVILSKGKMSSICTPREFSQKTKHLMELGVRPTQVAQVASMLDERGLWNGNYPINESEAADMIEHQFFNS